MQVLNERAVSVIQRVSNKLKGRDFSREELDVPATGCPTPSSITGLVPRTARGG